MHRFFVPNAPKVGESFELPKSEAHHAVSVLRVRVGDTAIALDGKGRALRCEVESCGRRQVSLRAGEETVRPRTGGELILVQAVAKGKAMDLIIQKATELGVARVVPVITERTVARPDSGDYAAKRDKWRDIAIEACKQCGAVWLPEVDEPMTLGDALATCRPTGRLSLVTALEEGAMEIRAGFEAFRGREGREPDSVSIWVGPEGDFSENEMIDIKAAGAIPVTLGELTLRSETAAICGLSIAGAELRTAAAPG